MPTLLLHHSGQQRGIVLNGRMLIGRVAPAGLIVPDPSVSRIHAWIDRDGDRFYIADAGSRAGTLVDNAPIAARHPLADGDVIRIGVATLQYRETDDLPPGIQPEIIAHTNGVAQPAAGGILFACACGAPLWAPLQWVGRRGKCNLCGQRTPVPSLVPSIAASLAPLIDAATATTDTRPTTKTVRQTIPDPVPQRQCSICQWVIESGEPQHACPSCGLTFHLDCWETNKGCSAYGCASVAALAEPEESQPAPEIIPQPAVEEPPERFPIEFAMLGASVLCGVIGLISFGVPPALLAITTTGYWLNHRRTGRSLKGGIVAAAMAMCMAGLVAGIWFSSFRWLHRPLGAPLGSPWQHLS
jgi:hypothetical protein